MVLPQGAIDWSAVCYCGITNNTHLHNANLTVKLAESVSDSLSSLRNISRISSAVKLSLCPFKDQ